MEDLLKRLAKSGATEFVDEEFPPNEKSLGDLNKGTIVWLRPSEIFSNPELFSDGITANDIQQGGLGDCYFLSSLSVLAEKPGRIKKLFEHHIPNKYGAYCITMYVGGFYRDVIVDDLIPCDPRSRAPKFTRANGEELWVILVEKAYAKANGSYEAIVGGNGISALVDLTGQPCFRRFTEKQTDDEIWEILTHHDRLDHAICSGCLGEEGEGFREKYGLIRLHEYGILRVKEFKGEKLVRLRNPWGQTEWKGKWSDGDTESWTPEAKRALHYIDADDGSFWMPFEYWRRFYDDYSILLTEEGWHYKSIPVTLTGKKKILSLTTQEQTDLYITAYLGNDIGCRMCVLAKEKPFIPLGGQPGENYQGSKNQCTDLIRLPKGQFVVYIEVSRNDLEKLPFDAAFAVYASNDKATISEDLDDSFKDALEHAEYCTTPQYNENGCCEYCGICLPVAHSEFKEKPYHSFCICRCYFCGVEIDISGGAYSKGGHIICDDCYEEERLVDGKPAAVVLQEKLKAEMQRIEEERIPKKPEIVEHHHQAQEEQQRDNVSVTEIREQSEAEWDIYKNLRAKVDDATIRRMFATVDVTSEGLLDEEKVADLVLMLGLPLSTIPKVKEIQMRYVMDALDEDGDYGVDYKEFHEWYTTNDMEAYAQFLDFLEKISVLYLALVEDQPRWLNTDDLINLHEALVEKGVYSDTVDDFIEAISPDYEDISLDDYVQFMLEHKLC